MVSHCPVPRSFSSFVVLCRPLSSSVVLSRHPRHDRESERPDRELKKTTTSQQRKWSTAIVNGKKHEGASTGNAFTFRYVPAVARLHMVFPVLMFILVMRTRLCAKPREDSEICAISTNKFRILYHLW